MNLDPKGFERAATMVRAFGINAEQASAAMMKLGVALAEVKTPPLPRRNFIVRHYRSMRDRKRWTR